jgi:hypothetical protein
MSITQKIAEAVSGALMKCFGEVQRETPQDVVTEEMVSYEVIYEPLVKDAHGEWMSEETLANACENFNQNLAAGIVQSNLFHLQDTQTFTIEDTWIQKEFDIVVEATGEKIKAGAWVCKIKYHDEDLWEMKKSGVIGGVSIGGRGSIDAETGEITNVNFDGDLPE